MYKRSGPRVMPPQGVVGFVSHIGHKYFSPRNTCLGNLASYVIQRRRRLQYVLFDMLSKYFVAQMKISSFCIRNKKTKEEYRTTLLQVKL